MTKLSAIIVNYLSTEKTASCIRSLQQSSTPPEEIIVINNSPEDLTLEPALSGFNGVKIINAKENGGFSAGINLGVKNSSGPLLLLLNPDIIFEQQAITKMLNHFESNPGIGIIGPRVLNSDGSVQNSARSFPQWRAFFFNRRSLLTKLFPRNRHSLSYLSPVENATVATEVDWVSGCCMMVRREAFDAVGGFDIDFFLFMEDTDFCRRVWNTPFTVAYLPSAEVSHDIGISNNNSHRLIALRHKSIRLFVDRYFSSTPSFFRAMAKAALWLRQLSLHTINALSGIFRKKKW